MKEKIKRLYDNSTLAAKIRYFYLLFLIPTVIFLVFLLYNLWIVNRSYESMINSSVVASEFSLDFKKDFDYETYLLIVENKSIEEAKLDDMLNDANRIVERLEEFTNSKENMSRLNSAKKYLKNLGIYKERIEQNLIEGNKYEVNIEIWENDVQIVTSLLQDTIFQYIYYEISDLQHLSADYQDFFIRMVRFFILSFAGIMVLLLFLSYYIPLSITRPIRKLSEVTDQVAKGDLSVHFEARSGMEVSRLSDSLNTMIDKINELLEQVTTEQIRLRKAEFELLQTQINPHFLYNTLDTIIWLAEAGKQREVVSMVGSLSEFFRTSLNQGKDIIPVREELQHVKSYLEIQQVRYQDILKYEIQVPGELDRYLIPKITIQPIVENALYHGIKNKRGVGHIYVIAREEEDQILFYVRDDGIGMKPDKLSHVRTRISQGQTERGGDSSGFGLVNVNQRLKLNYGEEYGLKIESVYGEGTEVMAVIPKGRKIFN